MSKEGGKGSKGTTACRIYYLCHAAQTTHTASSGNLSVHLRTNTNTRTKTARHTFSQRDTDMETSCHYEAFQQTNRFSTMSDSQASY